MRLAFECLSCGTHYLPPEDLAYPNGEAASPVWCSPCLARMRQAGVEEPPGAAAAALIAARLHATAPVVEEPAKPDVRPSRPARTRRARSGPGGARSRLS
jgi:hypothetical protein